MDRRDTKHRTENAFAEGIQKHCIWSDFLSLSQIPQCIIICMGCAAFSQPSGGSTNISTFVTTGFGGVISEWRTVAQTDEGDLSSSVSGSPFSAAEGYSQQSKGGLGNITES